MAKTIKDLQLYDYLWVESRYVTERNTSVNRYEIVEFKREGLYAVASTHIPEYHDAIIKGENTRANSLKQLFSIRGGKLHYQPRMTDMQFHKVWLSLQDKEQFDKYQIERENLLARVHSLTNTLSNEQLEQLLNKHSEETTTWQSH